MPVVLTVMLCSAPESTKRTLRMVAWGGLFFAAMAHN